MASVLQKSSHQHHVKQGLVFGQERTLKRCSVAFGLPCKAVSLCIYVGYAWRFRVADRLIVLLLQLVLCLSENCIAAWVAPTSAWPVNYSCWAVRLV